MSEQGIKNGGGGGGIEKEDKECGRAHRITDGLFTLSTLLLHVF